MQLFNNGTVNTWHFVGLTSFRQNDYIYCTSITWHNQNKASLIEQYLMINTFPWNFPSLPLRLYIDKWCSFTLMLFFSEQEAHCPMTAPTEFTTLPRCLRQFSNKVFSVSVDCQLNQYALRAQSLEGRTLALIQWN